jgi:ATP-dependent DNA ligase
MLLRTRPAAPSGFIEPCLPSPAEHRPSGPGWIHEIKHDGFRLMARRDAAGVRLLTGLQLNEQIAESGDVVFRHACKLGFEGIVSKRLGSIYRSGRSKDWLKFKNPAAPAVKREAEEDWGKERWR